VSEAVSEYLTDLSVVYFFLHRLLPVPKASRRATKDFFFFPKAGGEKKSEENTLLMIPAGRRTSGTKGHSGGFLNLFLVIGRSLAPVGRLVWTKRREKL